MGGSSSKAAGAVSRSKGVVEAAASAAKNRIRKEGQQFMASERAQEALRQQEELPKRAPMNLGSAKISDDVRSRRMEEIEKQQQEDKSYLSLMKDIYLSSTDPEGFSPAKPEVHSAERSDDVKNKLPQKQTQPLSLSHVPRGRANLQAIIDAMYNHRINPEDWGAREVAEKINIRESDANDILKSFELLEGTSIFKIAAQSHERRSGQS